MGTLGSLPLALPSAGSLRNGRALAQPGLERCAGWIPGESESQSRFVVGFVACLIADCVVAVVAHLVAGFVVPLWRWRGHRCRYITTVFTTCFSQCTRVPSEGAAGSGSWRDSLCMSRA